VVLTKKHHLSTPTVRIADLHAHLDLGRFDVQNTRNSNDGQSADKSLRFNKEVRDRFA